jgi:tetratricopeptide (TPR) repeat protein
MNLTLEKVQATAGLVISLGLIGWGICRMIKRSYDPKQIILKLTFTVPFVLGCIFVARLMGPFGPFLIVFLAVVMSLMWTPHLANALVSPFTNLLDGGDERPDEKPFYSIANTKRKRGEYQLAIAEVRKQLERFPNDFEGTMLLASIYAENLNDLPGADTVLNRFCDSKNAPDKHVAAAWTALADWHMKVGVDVDSARGALQKIIARYPETELALKAEQRLAHLGDTEKLLLEHHNRPRIQMKKGVDNIGLMDNTDFLKPKEIEPGKLAAAYVKQLETHPHDTETREKLATLYAREFQRLDLATMELEFLINEKRHSAKQIAGWLNQLANYQCELGSDIETVKATLQRILDDYPDLPLADVTRRRMVRLEAEFRAKETVRPGVKMGTYEQNIGLKYGRPNKPG